jgi:putative endonuclease
MNLYKRDFGKTGEKTAANYLTSKGFKIREVNFRSKFGEIDLIAEAAGKIHFIEVKSRSSTKKGLPYEAVNFYKIKHLQKAIQYYLLKNKLHDYKLSLDIMSIIMKPENNSYDIKHYENISSF